MNNLDSKAIGLFFLELYRKASILPEEELYEYFLDHAVKITKSTIGFFHFVGSNQKTIILTTWNKEALKNCSTNFSTHYPIEQAGNWADSVRLKRPIIYNEYANSPNQKGLPEGHVAINRLLTFPIIEEDEVQAIFGVGNKTEPYVKSDIVRLNLVATELNKILKLRQSEKRYHQLFSSMDEGFFLGEIIVDKHEKPVDWVFLEANDAFEKQSGLSLKDIVGKPVKQVLPKIESSWIQTYGKVALSGKSVRFEDYNEDTKRWYEVYSYCPEKNQFAAIFTDITKRKETEEKLAIYQKDLESLIDERTKQLKDSERLAAIGATAGMVGHDIRNPLQVIVSDIYLAKSELDSIQDVELKQRLKKNLEGIDESVFYINKIVQDLQDFGKPIMPTEQETDLETLCQEVLNEIMIPKNVVASCEIQKNIKKMISDPTLLKRIITNLVINAVQAMPQGGKLEVKAVQKAGDTIITVQDTGVGIAEGLKSKLFNPLVTTKAKGQGFGLAAVKRLTEALGGAVTFESQVGKGTEFIIRLPQSNRAKQ